MAEYDVTDPECQMINDRIEYATVSTTYEYHNKATLQCRFVVTVHRPLRLLLWLLCGTPDVPAATAAAAAAAATVHGLIQPIGNVIAMATVHGLGQPKGTLVRHRQCCRGNRSTQVMQLRTETTRKMMQRK